MGLEIKKLPDQAGSFLNIIFFNVNLLTFKTSMKGKFNEKNKIKKKKGMKKLKKLHLS